MSGTCAAGLKNGVLTVVGFGAFENCIGDNSRPNINSVVIEDGVTHIADNAFYGCGGLTSVSIPASVTSIGDGAFSGCGNLATITVDANNQTFDSPEGSNAIIRKADNTLILGCKTTVIPASVTSIGASAFYGCSGLTTISIPDGVTSIGDLAFYGCSGLTTISIPDGVQSIGDGAFGACFNLESVNIGSGVTSIAESAFNDCDKLATITVDTGNQTFDSREGCNAIIRKADNTLVAGCKTTVIPNSVTNIGDMAFWNHDGLTSITIPASVQSIGESVFYMCDGLSTVTIGSGVTSIGNSAFRTSALESVTIYATSVPTLGSDVFWGNKSGRKFYVFSDCVDAYKAAWGTYANDIEAIAPVASGTCGAAGNEANVTWQVAGEAGNYILYISGTGDMAEYDSANDVPWATYKASITTAAISAGVTTINSCAFNQGTIINLSYTGSVPDGYTFGGYTVTDAGSNPVSVTGNNGVYTFTMPASNVTVTANLIEKIPYIDENGTTAYCTNYTVLQGGGATTLQPGWYVVNSDISYTGTVTIGNGEATIILCDGKTMNVGTSESRINNTGINDGSGNHSSALTIYGQSLDDATAGHLNIYTTGIGDDGINLYSSYTQHSGNVTISTTGSPAYGIYAAGGLTLNGGTLSVTVGNTTAIRCNHTTITGGKLDATTGDANKYYGISDGSGDITLGYTNASDYIHVSGYSGTVNIAYGQVFTDGNGNNFYGTITDASTIAGKMLTPSNTFSVAANQNPAAVGEYWATFHNPVAGYTVPSGTTAYIGTVNGSSLTLTEVEGGFIPAGNAVILKGTSASFDLSRADTGDAFDFTANELKGGSTVADGKVAYTLAAKNGVVGFYKFAGASLNPYKAHLEIATPAQQAPAFFGFDGGGENTTDINEHESHQSHEFSGDYYTLDGRKLQGKPTQKGIYVRNGRKIIIK